MTEYAVEIRNVTKLFSSKRGKSSEEVCAVKEMNLLIPRGKFFTLLGPSGCGKTTTLRLIAGFELPTTGEVLIQGKPMTNVPPNLRPVNTVFQNYALFPHMNVAKNVGFGLEIKRVPRPERKKRIQEALELVQLGDMGNRKPSQLSGGQQQRVALARALVNKPSVLLLDEPLGALDLKLRKAMQIELKQLQVQVGITFIYVTHDQEEALTMSDQIAVMNKGLILQLGDPMTLYKKPTNRFVADFIGESNFIEGTVKAVENGNVLLQVGEARVAVPRGGQPLVPGQEVFFTVRPEKMRLASPSENATGALSGVVQDVVYIGTDTRYLIVLTSGKHIIVRVQNGCGVELNEFQKGDQAQIIWQPEDAHILSE
jgi:spermidine/putrescine transport system ATP-binding protein